MKEYMGNNLLRQLEHLGLTKEEARVYLAVLELDNEPVSTVAHHAKLNRTSCYNYLESLAAKQFVSRSRYKGRRSYVAEAPNQFLVHIDQEKKQLELIQKQALAVQDQLNSLYARKHKKPIIKYVEGVEGLISLYEESLRTHDPEGIRSYTSISTLFDAMGDYADEYVRRRVKRNIRIRAISPDTPFGRRVKKDQHLFLREARLIPKERFDFSPEIYLYDNKFSVKSFKERFGFLVESKEITSALKKAWDLAWERAEQYDKEIEKMDLSIGNGLER